MSSPTVGVSDNVIKSLKGSASKHRVSNGKGDDLKVSDGLKDELKLIEERLSYDEENQCWVATYPFLYPRDTLKGSKEVALKAMLSMERTLHKKGNWNQVYQKQIKDMIQRGVAREVPDHELDSFEGHVKHLPHLAAINMYML